MHDSEQGIVMYCNVRQCAWDNYGLFYPEYVDDEGLGVREDCKAIVCDDCSGRTTND